MSQLILSPMPINALSPGFGTMAGLSTAGISMPAPGGFVVILRQQRDGAYCDGHWWSVMDNMLADTINNIPPHSMASNLRGDLMTAHHADQLKCTAPGTPDKDAWQQGRNFYPAIGANNEPPPLNPEQELSGGIFSPMKALAHAILGKGIPLYVDIQNTGINPQIDTVPELRRLINAAPLGESKIDTGRIGYSTAQDSIIAGQYLGNITLHIRGDLHRSEHGKISFHGEAKAYNDLYDADRSNHRTPMGTASTIALQHIMEASGGQDYEIIIRGAIPISYNR